MSYDPHSWICIPIHYAPVELKIGTLRGATDRALHGTSKGVVGGGGRAGGSRDDKSKGPPARRVASLSPSPLPADRSPPPPPLLLSLSCRFVPHGEAPFYPFREVHANVRARLNGETTRTFPRERNDRKRPASEKAAVRGEGSFFARARFSVSSRGANRATKAARTDVLNRAQTNHFGTVARKHSCAMPRH